MKDHSLNSEERKTFILSYKIEDDKIIVKLANKENYIVPYTVENERSILEKMRTQICESVPYADRAFPMLRQAFGYISGVLLPVAIFKVFAEPGLVSILLTGGLALLTADAVSVTKKELELKKLKYFLESESKLNYYFRRSENVFLGLEEQKAKQLKADIKVAESHEQNRFNFGNVDNYSLSDLKKIKDNLMRIRDFDLTEPPMNLEEEKGIQKTLKK